ncbi:MAG TPA: hypothetical protein VMU59_14075 [Caulobacteraceae bacterium]|nr:hypothetical protein [Caulobacteraceae bacterium]
MRVASMFCALGLAFAGGAHAQPVRVPFIGCSSDGQLGPQTAPKDDGKAPELSAALAARLGWYVGNYVKGVLAPRGWRCIELYGSNGATLLVTPARLGDASKGPVAGPAVQLSVSVGDTSGRFEAARIAARLFPRRRAFVDAVIAEKLEPKADFVFGPYPDDRIRRLGPDVVAFVTPARKDGMGTMSRLAKSGEPIEGLAVMDEDNDATVLAVRLAAAQHDLALAIVDVAEQGTR